MASLKSIELEVESVKDLALISSDDAVWLVVPVRWWDLSTLLWWLLCPADKRALVKLTVGSTDEATQKVRFRAIRVASRHMRVRGTLR